MRIRKTKKRTQRKAAKSKKLSRKRKRKTQTGKGWFTDWVNKNANLTKRIFGG